MSNIIDFIKIQGGKTMDELPFTPVDAAVLCQLSYLKFEFTPEARTLIETMTAPDRNRLFEDDRFGHAQRDVYFEAVFSRRYQNMVIENVQSVLSEDEEISYCALTFRPEGGAPAVVFRGTDEHIVGWKEDFKLAVEMPIPSQTLAVEYIKDMAEPFYVCGHSKGGNLAVYSAIFCPDVVRKNIKMVYNLDGPGFMEDITERPEFKELNLTKLVPERSFVGMLLKDSTTRLIVDSRGPGILQHMLFNWDVDEFGDFKLKGENPSTVMGIRFTERASALSEAQLSAFVEGLFGIMEKAKVDDLVEFKNNWVKDSRRILEALTELDPDTRKLLADTVAELLI